MHHAPHGAWSETIPAPGLYTREIFYYWCALSQFKPQIKNTKPRGGGIMGRRKICNCCANFSRAGEFCHADWAYRHNPGGKIRLPAKIRSAVTNFALAQKPALPQFSLLCTTLIFGVTTYYLGRFPKFYPLLNLCPVVSHFRRPYLFFLAFFSTITSSHRQTEPKPDLINELWLSLALQCTTFTQMEFVPFPLFSHAMQQPNTVFYAQTVVALLGFNFFS